ncbi:MAG TPA: NADP-dependent oxidoreductase [Solirubrobacteraceae bacterium]
MSARVVVAEAYGGPEVLALREEPVPEPGAGEVLLDVRAAGVNPIDWKRYSGAFGRDPAELPMRLGNEAAGVAGGREVIAFRIGGAYATHVVVPESALVPKPAALSWEQAAGLMLAGVTAMHALVATGVGEEDTLLLHAASGGVGLMAVQIARARGARVIGTASERHHERLRALGAEPVVYGEGLADRVRALAPDGVDAAIDAVGTDEAIDVSLELVPNRSRIATIAAFGRAQAEGFKALGGGPGADPGTEIRDAARFELVELVERGELTVDARAFPLADAAAAHEAGIAGRADGKLVLVP